SAFFAPAAPAPIVITSSAAAPQKMGASRRRPSVVPLPLTALPFRSPVSPGRMYPTSGGKVKKRRRTGATLGDVLAKVLATGVIALALAPSGASIAPPSQPGPWKVVGKVATSRRGAKLHIS